MNYIQILADLDAKLSRYHSRLWKMKNSDGQKYTFADMSITRNKIDKMEKLFPKVGKKVAQQFNQEEIKVVNLSEFEPSNDIGGWEIPK